MTSWTSRSAESLVHGLDGPVVVVSARIAAVLTAPEVLGTWRRAHRGDDAELDQVLVALTVAGIEYRNRLAGRGQERAPITVTDASLAMTTAQAADRLSCSPRTVIRAIRDRKLAAHRVGHMWLVAHEDIEHYAAQRDHE